MKQFYEVFCVVILSAIVGSSGIPVSRKIIRTNVINHAYCKSSLSEEDKMDKKTLEEVHTYAE